MQPKVVHIDLSGPAPQQAQTKTAQLLSHAPSATPEKRRAESPAQKGVIKREAVDEPLSINKKPRLSDTSDVKSETPKMEVDKSSLEVIKKACAENAALEMTIVKRDQEIEGLKQRIKELGEEIMKLGQDGKQTVDALVAEREELEGRLKQSQMDMKTQ